jgi:hypothetical protein
LKQDLDEIDPVTVEEIPQGHLILGHRHRGHPLPIVALVKDGALVWATTLSKDVDGAPEEAMVQGDNIAILYNGHLIELDAATGATRFDVPIRSGKAWLAPSSGRWLLAGDKTLLALDTTNGAPSLLYGPVDQAAPSWSKDQPVPPGYRVERKTSHEWVYVGLGAAGIVTVAAINTACAYVYRNDGAGPLYIPVVGPFVAMGTVHHADSGVVQGLIYDFFAQAIVITTFTTALATGTETKTLVPIRTSFGPGSIRLETSF